MRKVFRDIKPRVPNFVRVNVREVIVETPESELGWLDSVVKDLNLKATRTETPIFQAAPCGDKTVDVKHHLLSCSKCRVLRGLPAKPVPGGFRPDYHPRAKKDHNGKVETKFHLPGIPDLSLNGLISLMVQRRDEALQIGADLDSAINAVSKFETLNNQIAEMQAERDEMKKAMAYFLHEEKA
jgi:hypothetical protein